MRMKKRGRKMQKRKRQRRRMITENMGVFLTRHKYDTIMEYISLRHFGQRYCKGF